MQEFYQELAVQMKTLISDNPALTSALANAASLLYERLERINWAGFYLKRNEELILGPFCGKIACLRIPMGKGVCGTAGAERKTVLVPDVHAFPGHIACDSASRSEIVIPLIQNQELMGVLDIDSMDLNRFTPDDREGLEQIGALISALPEWNGYRIL